MESYQEMNSEDEDSADHHCGSLTCTSKRHGHNCQPVYKPLNRKSLKQLSGSYPALGREDGTGDVSNSGHVAFSSPIVSKSCWFKFLK